MLPADLREIVDEHLLGRFVTVGEWSEGEVLVVLVDVHRLEVFVGKDEQWIVLDRLVRDDRIDRRVEHQFLDDGTMVA